MGDKGEEAQEYERTSFLSGMKKQGAGKTHTKRNWQTNNDWLLGVNLIKVLIKEKKILTAQILQVRFYN